MKHRRQNSNHHFASAGTPRMEMPVIRVAAKSRRHVELAKCDLIYESPLSFKLQQTITDTENRFNTVEAPEPTTIEVILTRMISNDDQRLEYIRHPLGSLAESEAGDTTTGAQCTKTESAVLQRYSMQNSCPLQMTCANDFLRTLQEITSLLTKTDSKYRTTPVTTAAGKSKFFWQYPRSEYIRDSLVDLFAALQNSRRDTASRLKISILAYLAINWIHPFPDGNGRLSRLIFNLIFQTPQRPRAHIPIKLFNIASRGHHEIALRHSVLTANPDPIIEYFIKVLNFYLSIAGRPPQETQQLNSRFTKSNLKLS